MKLLINKDNEGATEIRNLTGAYYQNNDFDRIRTDWILAQDELKKLIGSAVLNRAIDHYQSEDYPLSGSGDDTDDQLVEHIQFPLAYMATYRYYQANMVSHEDTGRKVKIDPENEKMAWEWMLDRDDAAHILKIHQVTDRLIDFLQEKQLTEWLTSPNRKLTRNLLVNTAALFHQAYPIDHSSKFFYSVTPFIDEVQRRTIKKALGTEYAKLLSYWQNFNSTSTEGSGSGSGLPGDQTSEYLEELLALVQKVMPLLVMIMAAKRLPLHFLPHGVVQQFQSMIQSGNSSQVPLPETIEKYCIMLKEDAQYALDDIKRLLNANDTEALDYQLLPENADTNKFFRT